MTARASRASVAMLLAAAAVATATAATLVLNFPTSNPAQERSQWCWAGVSQAVIAYYGTTVSQCTIANYASGYPGGDRLDCCSLKEFSENGDDCNNPNFIYNPWDERSWWNVPGGSLRGILDHWGAQNTPVDSTLDSATVIAETEAGRPFVMRFAWSYGGGHFLVGYGHEQNATYLDYWDPWPGNGATRSLYDWVVAASDHTWTHTLQITANPPANAPVFTDDPLISQITPIKAVHITELRQKVDQLRTRYGLGTYGWTDNSLGGGTTPVRWAHVAELRTALDDVFDKMERTRPNYSDPTLLTGVTVIKATHVTELRTAILGIW